MTPYKTRKPKIVTVALRLAICLAFMLGIVFASPTFAVYAKDGTQIDTLGVAFGKVNVGDSLADAFEFENEAEGTLKVPSGANYTATLLFISKKGQAITLWEKDKASLPWSGVENQLVEKNVAYCIRVRFSPKENYQLSKDVALLRRNMQILGGAWQRQGYRTLGQRRTKRRYNGSRHGLCHFKRYDIYRLYTNRIS